MVFCWCHCWANAGVSTLPLTTSLLRIIRLIEGVASCHHVARIPTHTHSPTVPDVGDGLAVFGCLADTVGPATPLTQSPETVTLAER